MPVILWISTVLVERLKAAGAIVIEKTTTFEFGWKGVNQSPLTGITHNHGNMAITLARHLPELAPLATVVGLLHHGGDGAGSIRCLVIFVRFGIKPFLDGYRMYQ